jgi:REP-associated tyrosine transposase
MNIDPTMFHRRSIRLKDYDYFSPGAYFVTIVTHSYKCIFGKIIDQELLMNHLGKIVEQCWVLLPDHFLGVEVQPYMVMPNHIHGIITIHENDCRGTIYRAPTAHDERPIADDRTRKTEKFGQPVIGSLPTIIRTYKAAVSRIARKELTMVNIWQRNYYEHIIRNQSDLESIANYILANPVHWSDDPEYIHEPPRNLL